MLRLKNIIKKTAISIHNHELSCLFYLTFFILLMGTIAYHHIENWGWLDSFYFSVTTLTTVGFGNIAPETNFGKLFTVFYIFLGIGVIFSFITAIGHTNQSLRRKNRK
ncbi:two pore domain potassium channel family protein [Patescibacteria group bacterium]|nr:two pore domain potassium channel family protein [Patescibacteria group bacterium]